MRALSIRQPWAWAVAAGHKSIENRSWQTAFRGQLAIHASVAFVSLAQFERCEALAGREVPPDLATGAVIAVATLADIVTESADPWFVGPYGWILVDVLPIPPIRCVGRQLLFQLPHDVDVRVQHYLRRYQAH